MAGMFDSPLGLGARERRTGPAIRLIKRGSGHLTIDLSDEVNISVVLSEGAELALKHDSRTNTISPRLAEHGVMVPGHPMHVTITGGLWALQMRLSFAELRRAAEEDHGIDPARVDLAPVVAGSDAGLVRRIWAGLRPDPVLGETVAREVAAYLLQGNLSQGPGPGKLHGGMSPARLRRVFDLVEANLREGVTLGRMADEAALSPFHFARAFKRSAGCPPHEYLLRRRLARAATLLRNPRLAVSEIADRVGFAHASHLGHRLRREYGTSCTEFRAMLDF